jgi:hypothetical protein
MGRPKWIFRSGACAMCGKSGVPLMVKNITPMVDGMDKYESCSDECESDFFSYLCSNRTNLERGVPHIYFASGVGDGAWDDPPTEVGKPLTCAQCGRTGEWVVRNYGLPDSMLRRRDFCANRDCCASFVSSFMNALKMAAKRAGNYPKLFCYMCGGTGDDVRRTSIPDCWGALDTFCRFCYDKYQIYRQSKKTDLTYGSPYFLTTDHFQRCKYTLETKVIKFIPDHEKPLMCNHCGQKGDGVVRHYEMPTKYSHTDFCKNAVCCKSYIDYRECEEMEQKYAKRKQQLVKPVVL